MNFTKTKKIVAAGLSALMMMSSTTSVFATESGDKSTTLNYQVSPSYDWIIHSSIDFGADAGPSTTVERTENNQVKVLENVIPEGKYLNISVKGSGTNDAFTVDNGGSEVLNYDVSDDNGAVGVNGNVLSVPAGTNTATQNMGFKLNTTKKSAEVAGQYKGQVIYNASVGDKNGGTTSGGSTSGGAGGSGGSESSGGTVTNPDGIKAGKIIKINDTSYTVLKQTGNNKFEVCKNPVFTNPKDYNKSAEGTDDFNIYENSDIDNYLENTWYLSLPEQLRSAIELTEITQVSYDSYDRGDGVFLISPDGKKYDTNYKGIKYKTLKRHVYLPSVEDLKPGNYAYFANTRDAFHSNSTDYIHKYITEDNTTYIYQKHTDNPGYRYAMNPAFIVDLSKVDYELEK